MSLEFRSRLGLLFACAMLGSLVAFRGVRDHSAESAGKRSGEAVARRALAPRPIAAREAVQSLLPSDPLEAAVFAEGIATESERLAACQLVARRWILTDPAAAWRWIMDQGDATLRDRLISTSIQEGATMDPCAALEWAVGSIQSDDLLESTVLSVIDRWAETRPAEAAALIDQLPSDRLREKAANAVAVHWNRTNPTVAYIWMKGSPEGERLIAGLSPAEP